MRIPPLNCLVFFFVHKLLSLTDPKLKVQVAGSNILSFDIVILVHLHRITVIYCDLPSFMTS